MNTWANNLFYLIFLSQILLTSYYVPKRLLARMDRLLTEYPPERFPKLYPRPVEFYRFGQSVFRWASRCVLLLGFAALYGAYALDGGQIAKDGYISEAWPAVYGMIQFMPLMAMELMGFRQFQLMREANTDSKRTAVLRPRRLLDHVSWRLVLLTAVLLAANIAFAVYLKDFQVSLTRDATQQALVVIGTNLALMLVGAWQLYGRKLDPYQTAEDRSQTTKVQLTSLFLVSCALSIFIITKWATDAFDLHFLDAPLISVYFQVIVALSIGYVLRSLHFEDINFDVYSSSPKPENDHV